MRIEIMRLVRDFAEVANDYRVFMVRSTEAAMSWQSYWARACKDLHDAMSARDSDSADHCADLPVYNEVFASK